MLPAPVTSACVPYRFAQLTLRRALLGISIIFAVLWLLHTPATAPRRALVISVASSSARIGHELDAALATLVRQLTRLDELHLYLSLADEDALKTMRHKGTYPPVLDSPVIRLHFVDDLGPATKFVYVLEDLVQRARHGEAHLMDQPVLIADDDHAYSPHLVKTLLDASEATPSAMVGLRGWRVREDLQWGVANEYLGHHVQHGADIAAPYRVSVLTANHGYMLKPSFLFSREGTTPAEELLFNRTALAASPAHLVDDIVMNGLLAQRHVERYIVPLKPLWATPNVDLTRVHPLEKHMAADGFTRQDANNAALEMFASAWREENLFYDYKEPAPAHIGLFVRAWRGIEVLLVKLRWRSMS